MAESRDLFGSAFKSRIDFDDVQDLIAVDDAQIRIRGSKDVLERAVLASPNGAIRVRGWY
jgi:hypothetical protein